jgi:hypothetical protein
MADLIFINYRRGTSARITTALHNRLRRHFGPQRVFMDVNSIGPGDDYINKLLEKVAECAAFIAVIGPGWSDLKDDAGRRRLDNPHDPVRVEMEAALRRDIHVYPVRVDGAQVPPAERLPDPLKPLVRHQAFEIRPDRFDTDAGELPRRLGATRHSTKREDAKPFA